MKQEVEGGRRTGGRKDRYGAEVLNETGKMLMLCRGMKGKKLRNAETAELVKRRIKSWNVKSRDVDEVKHMGRNQMRSEGNGRDGEKMEEL